jgi:hypothetical protein
MTVVDAVFPPLVPFTVTVYCPAEPEQDKVEFPDTVKLVALRLQDRPVLGETVSLSVTVPMKAGEYVTVIVVVPVEPTTTATLGGLVVTVNAVPTVNLTETDRDKPLPVPVTVTLKLPEAAESVHDRVEVREVVVVLNAKLAGFKTHERPIVGETVLVKATVPVKP